MKAYFINLFGYDIWANRQLLEKFEQQFPQNARIYELFSHTISVQRVWLDRVLGIPQSVAVFQDRLPEEMKEDMENYHAAWVDFLSGLEADSFDRKIHYKNTAGDTFDTALVDIITQVTNHGTHHRGNLMILMKEEGFVLPQLDYITYTRR